MWSPQLVKPDGDGSCVAGGLFGATSEKNKSEGAEMLPRFFHYFDVSRFTS
jgi:hypothetical protein